MANKMFPVYLPEDHPAFSIPKGARNEKIREWIRLGMMVEQYLFEIKDVKQEIMSLREEVKNIKVVAVSDERKDENINVNKSLAEALDGFLDI